MTPDEAKTAVAFDGVRVVARYADGSVRAQGEAYGYSVVPVLYILTDEGERVSWRHDLCESVPSPAEQTVARLDSYTQEQHADGIQSARTRAVVRADARKERAATASARLREDCEHRMVFLPGTDPWANKCEFCGLVVTLSDDERPI